MSLVIFCLLFFPIDYVLVKGEIIWHLSLTVWLISLSIMLSSPIQVVAKGICSFFLSASGTGVGTMRRGDYRNYYKGHMDKIKGESGGGVRRWVWLGWGGDWEKRHKTVIE